MFFPLRASNLSPGLHFQRTPGHHSSTHWRAGFRENSLRFLVDPHKGQQGRQEPGAGAGSWWPEYLSPNLALTHMGFVGLKKLCGLIHKSGNNSATSQGCYEDRKDMCNVSDGTSGTTSRRSVLLD